MKLPYSGYTLTWIIHLTLPVFCISPRSSRPMKYKKTRSSCTATKCLVMEDTNGKFHTFEEYKIATETLQKNKDGKQVILYTTNPVQQDAYIQAATSKGYYVVKMETLVDAAFINTMEMKWDGIQF